MDGHIPDDVLEQYVMDHVPEPELRSIEDHLRVCDDCLARFTSMEQQQIGPNEQ
jgi:hypothetical protein